MELGEMFNAMVGPDPASDHDENACPWHTKADEPADRSFEPSDAEDDAAILPKNSAGKLATALGQAGAPYPGDLQVRVGFKESRTVDVPVVEKGKSKIKSLSVYEPTTDGGEVYDVTFAAHHLIPGNEALGGHPLLAWMGGDDKIERGKRDGTPSSKLKNGLYCGYDMNHRENGIWLPGPYALSTNKKWPSEDLMARAKLEAEAVVANNAFKRAYAFALIEGVKKALEDAASLPNPREKACGCQFHGRHEVYSRFVRGCLAKIHVRALKAAPKCPLVKKDESGKLEPVPAGLTGRLHAISHRMRPYLSGVPWSRFIYTDELTKDYLDAKSLDVVSRFRAANN